ncbi:hypothetical protein [Shewanella sp.]|uniref:hypothetical protein n=1 Tax=Shewanella sp. TaxID=50422 RepID=UPI004054471E
MKFTLLVAALPLCVISGCSYPRVTEPVMVPTLTGKTISDTSADPSSVSPKKIKLLCSVPPPPKDTSKLIQNLREQGVITESMSTEQINAEVASYIYKRQQAFKNCNKGN